MKLELLALVWHVVRQDAERQDEETAKPAGGQPKNGRGARDIAVSCPIGVRTRPVFLSRPSPTRQDPIKCTIGKRALGTHICAYCEPVQYQTVQCLERENACVCVCVWYGGIGAR